jgi:hypothetical protein
VRHPQARHAHGQQDQQVDQSVLLYASFHEKLTQFPLLE